MEENWKERALKAEARYRRKNDHVTLMVAAMTEFCMRVDRGEVRSVRTYAQFKEIIKEVTNCEW